MRAINEQAVLDIIDDLRDRMTVEGYCAMVERVKALEEVKRSGDLISRQALMKEFSDFVRASNNSDFARTPTWNDAVSLVGSMPSAQPNLQPICNQLATDCISRQAVTDTVRTIILGFFSDEDGVMTDTEKTLLSVNKAICNGVRELPSAQPERKTGRWMATEADEPCFYRCSECGRLIDERENYCPHCGARMGGRMMRPIDGDALRDKLQNLGYDDWNQGAATTWAEAFYACADIVAEAPTIEPEPHWIPCDCIERQAAIDEAYSIVIDGEKYDVVQVETLMGLPSAQPEIVRCNDCLMHGVCRFEQGLGVDGYCSQAERRTDGSD